jgi:uncharacterized protein involved in exopolysaccharide biosynthesis
MSEEITQNLSQDPLRLILARLDSIDSQLDDLKLRMTTLEDKVDERLVETKPIWERALAEIAEVRAEMRAGFERLQKDMETGFYRASKKMDVVHLSIAEFKTDMRMFDDRLTELESS